MKVVFIPRSRSPFQVRIVMYTTLHTGFVDVRKKGADNSAIEETPTVLDDIYLIQVEMRPYAISNVCGGALNSIEQRKGGNLR